jgi:hypothetical protein
VHRLPRDDRGEDEQERAVELRGEDLGAAEAEGEDAAGGLRREPRRDQASAIEPASVSMCAASESSASDADSTPRPPRRP